MRKILLLSTIILLILPLQIAKAGGIVIDYPGKPGPLFSVSNWAPGDATGSTVTITNTDSVSQKIGFKLENANPNGILADMITLKVRNNPGGSVRYSGSLKSLVSSGELELDTIAPSAQVKYDFEAEFDPSAGNAYQGLSETFDMSIGFIATPAPGPGPGPVPGPPIIFPFVSGGVTGFGRILGIGGTVAGATTEATEISPEGGIAGATTEKEAEGEEKDTGTAGVRTCPWWAIVAICLAVVLVVYGLYIEKKKIKEHRLPRYWYMWPAVFGLIAWIAHYFLHDAYRATWFCDWFWLIVLIEVIVAYIFYKFILKVEEAEEGLPKQTHF